MGQDRQSGASVSGAPSGLSSLPSTGTLPRSARILRRSDFRRVQSKGRRVHSSAFIVIALPEAEGPRLGCVVSKKVGDAPCRNRIKRMIREVFRRQRGRLGQGAFVIIAKRAADSMNGVALAEVLVSALDRASKRLEPT